MKARNSRGPRYDPGQSEAERQGYDNLLLLCPTHHRTIEAQPEAFPVALLKDMKARAEADLGESECPNDAFFAAALLAKLRDFIITENSGNIAINSPGAVQGGAVVVTTTRSKTKIAPPAGSIGADGDRRRYVKYLIDRDIQFANCKGRAQSTRPFQACGDLRDDQAPVRVTMGVGKPRSVRGPLRLSSGSHCQDESRQDQCGEGPGTLFKF